MNYIKDIALKNRDDSFNMIVEIPSGTKNKYELIDGTFEDVEVVRKIKYKYPFQYGCFAQTYAGDKDPLDAILLTNVKRKCLDVVKVQPIGVIKTIDNDEIDDKIFVIDILEPLHNIEKLKKKAIKFLKKYKGKHSNTIVDETFYDMEEAIKLINGSHSAYKSKNTNKINNLKIIL